MRPLFLLFLLFSFSVLIPNVLAQSPTAPSNLRVVATGNVEPQTCNRTFTVQLTGIPSSTCSVGQACSDACNGLATTITSTGVGPWCTIPGTRASGSQNTPLRTAWGAITLTAKLQPNDCVNVLPGTHNSSRGGTVDIANNNGFYQSDVTIRSSSPRAAIINGTGFGGPGVYIKADGIIWDGFKIQNSADGIAVNAYRDVIKNNYITAITGSGIWVQGPGGSIPAMGQVLNNEVDTCTTGGIVIWALLSGYYLIADNYVHNIKGNGNYDGIQVGGGDANLSPHHVIAWKNTVRHQDCSATGGFAGDPLDFGGHDVAFCANGASSTATCNQTGCCYKNSDCSNNICDTSMVRCSYDFVMDENLVERAGGCGGVKLHAGARDMCRFSNSIARRNLLIGYGWESYGYPNANVFYNNTMIEAGANIQFWDDCTSGDTYGRCPRTGNTTLNPLDKFRSFGGSQYGGGPGGNTLYGAMGWFNNYFGRTGGQYNILLNGSAGHRTDVRKSSMQWFTNVYNFGTGGIYWYPNDTTTVAKFYSASNFAAFQNENVTSPHDQGSNLTTQTHAQLFTNYTGNASGDYRPAAGSNLRGIGTCPTKTVGAGTGTTITVERSTVFHDGYGFPSPPGPGPDVLCIGTQAPVSIAVPTPPASSIDAVASTIKLAESRSWSGGQCVRPCWMNNPPDVGRYQAVN